MFSKSELKNLLIQYFQSDWEGESNDRDDMKLPGHMDSTCLHLFAGVQYS